MTQISQLPTLGGVTPDDFLIINDGNTETKRCTVDAFVNSIDLDSRYAPVDHNHAGVYSPVGHNHDGTYQPVGDYAPLVHNHDADYAAIGHDHDGVYQPVGDYQPLGDYAPTDAPTFTGQVNIANLPIHDDDASAGSGGLVAGDLYVTPTGELRVKL